MIFEKVLKNIDEGIAGLNVGLPFKVSKLHDCIPSISKGQCWLIGAETGCLGIHTKIIMYNGSLKNVEDIVIGDQLMGIDSTPRNVLSLHRGIEMMYDVIQNKGITYKVNQSHILSLKPSGERSNKKFNSITNIKISDFVNLNITDKKNLKGYKANSPLVTGIQIVKDKIDNYYGFNLDGDNLFLLEDFTVTHNCGKTSFVDDVFLYTPFEYIMSSSNINKYTFNVLYFSYEITSINKIAKAICRNLFLKHNKEIDTKILLSKGKYRLDSEIRKLVDFEKEYFEKLEKCINIYDIAENPTGIYKIVNRYAEQHFDKIEHSEFNIEYVEKNPNHYTIVIIDHAALVRKERGYDTKQTIDKLSEYLVGFRNKYNFITVLIQQLNRGLESTERKKAEMLYPQLSDFKDSANTQADSNIVLALFNPHKYNMTSLGNIVIDGTKKLRGCFVLKNRDGESDKNTVLEFVGSCGIFKTIN